MSNINLNFLKKGDFRNSEKQNKIKKCFLTFLTLTKKFNVFRDLSKLITQRSESNNVFMIKMTCLSDFHSDWRLF